MSNLHGDHWLSQRSDSWRRIEQSLPRLEDRRGISADELRAAVLDYPELARDVAIARRESPNSRVTTYLESIYNRFHRALFRSPRDLRGDLANYFSREIPEIVHGLRWQIFSVTLGFILAAVAGWLLIASFPDLVTLFASESMIKQVHSGRLWTDNILNVMPSSLLSAQIFTNNIIVAITAMVLGSLYGLGTIYIIGLNGLMLGAIFAFTHQHGLSGELFKFVFAHGVVELSVIFIAGAVGFSIGESLARPGELSRGRAFQRATQRGAKLMLLCCAFLVGAGIIEGYISPDSDFGMTTRVVVGLAYGVALLLALGGWKRLARFRPGGTGAVRGTPASPGTAAPPAG